MNKLFSLKELKIKENIISNKVKGLGLAPAGKKQPTNFTDIGLGKPLQIRLHTTYIGDLQTSVFRKKQDILISSTIKDDISYEVPIMAVHQLVKGKKDGALIFPSSRDEGTELIYYTKALDGGNLNINLEIKADKFDKNITDSIASGLSSASGIPIFLPFAPYMLAGSKIFSIAGSLANTLSEKTPLLSYDFQIINDTAGLFNSTSDFYIGANTHDRAEIEGYEITRRKHDNNRLYLSKNGVEYNGSAPYLIISINGASNIKYEGFKARAASTSIMNKFYGKGEKSIGDNLQEIMEVYNDYTYLKKSREMEGALKNAKNKKERAQIEALGSAYLENIINKDFFK